ncbi:unnamed protein product [Allacma fusca]|uniref:BTB domain-containing protein n=1 Tax=Allacma fusca TaxID=39272 RepID=A0A8J2K8W9_9HEXA|nr:unnamed protein product [Allacma fusca]
MRPGRLSLKAGLSSTSRDMKCLTSKDDGGPQKVMKEYFESQNIAATVATESPTDVLLIFDDGIIPTHAAILSGSSSFFKNIFETQGFIINPVREILMPEFSLQIMQKVIHLIYTSQVHLKSEKEAEEVRRIIKYLNIHVDSNLISVKILKSSTPATIKEVKVVPKSAKSQLLRKPLVMNSIVESSAEEDISPKGQKKSVRASQKKMPNDHTDSETDSKSGIKADSDDSDSDFDYAEKKIQKIRTRASKKVQTLKSTGGKDGRIQAVSVSVENLQSATNISVSNGKSVTKNTIATVRSVQNESSDGTDTSTDYDADETRYKNKKWFMLEAERCQKCKTSHKTAALASQCLTGHGRLRCYFCFRVVKNTEMLFNHFQRAHKKAGRENFVMCPFCDQSIPFKSVSCHVISLHLTDSNRSQNNPKTVNRSSTAGVNIPPAKRTKLASTTEQKESDLRVGNLDCTIRHVKSNGKSWVFVLRRERP